MKLSIILFVRRWDICDKTIASILTDKNKEYISDIIIIERSNESKKEDYLNNIKEKYGSCIKYIDEHTSSTNIMDTAVQMADGEYINVSEVGVKWNNNVVTEINKVTSKDDYDFLIMPCSHELMMSAYDTVFMSFFEEPKTINVYDKFKMFHIFYPSYFISKKLFIQNDFKTESDLLSILEKMFYLSCKSEFAYLLVNAKFSWDECSALKDIELEFQTHQERITDFIIHLEKYISNNTFTKNAQFQIATYLKYLFKFSTYYKGKISDERLNALKDALDNIINQLDVSMISLHGSFTSIQKALLFSKVKGMNLDIMYKDSNQFIFANNEKVVETEIIPVGIQFVDLQKDSVTIEGYIKHTDTNPDIDVYVKHNKKTVKCDILQRKLDEYWFEDLIGTGVTFSVKLDLDNNTELHNIEFSYKCNDQNFNRKKFIFDKYAPLASNFLTSYYDNNGWILSVNDNIGCLTLEKSSKLKVRRKEKAFINELKELDEISAKKAVIVRKLYFIMKKLSFRKKWLVSDRINHGDDNGEALLRSFKDKKIRKRLRGKKIYFVIDKNTTEFKELRKYGKTISTLSWQHKLNHLLSEYVISSHANNPVVNIFGVYNRYYKDILCRSKFVFLQHGVTKDDQSEWLNKYNRNIHGLICTTKAEYESIFNYNYYYDKSRVWLTGMPRYDRLYHAEKKYITFMPTWRKSLTTGADPVTGIWKMRDDFMTSSYYIFYNSILNDERLISAAKEYGYTICFMPHPNISHVVNRFDHHKDVIFLDSTKCYRDVFAETDLMLTDYSSVAFDFAYLRKPIIYTQYDREEFFNGAHSYTEGYYDYDKDGFGEVETDREAVIDRIIEYMKNDCKLKDEYLERINNTFAYDDKNCCKRIVDLLIDGYKEND